MDAGSPTTDPAAYATMVRSEASSSGTSRRSSWWTLPSDVLHESVRRIRVMAWLYALAYFLAGLLPPLITPDYRAVIFALPSRWVPMAVSVAGGLAVALLVGSPRLSLKAKLYLGLGFEVLGSLGIAITEYREVASPILFTPAKLSGGLGLSWVAPWVMLFSVVVPTRPITAVLTAAVLHRHGAHRLRGRDRDRQQRLDAAAAVLLHPDLSLLRRAHHVLRRLAGGVPARRRRAGSARAGQLSPA